MKHALIIGYGPGLSSGLAKAFGREGYQLSLLARNQQKLDQAVAELAAVGIKASAFTADAYQPTSVVAAAVKARQANGPVDLLLYNAAALKMRDILDETAETIAQDMNACAGSLLDLTKELLPELRSSKGGILATGGTFSLNPSPQFGSLSMGKAALRNLVQQLHTALKPQGIFVGTVTIGGYIQPSDPVYAPDALAQKFVQLLADRDAFEMTV
jgi:short-subunit dehydrogenase